MQNIKYDIKYQTGRTASVNDMLKFSNSPMMFSDDCKLADQIQLIIA